MIFLLLFAWWLPFQNPENANYLYYHQVEAQAGDGPLSLLKRYGLNPSVCNLDQFYELNKLEAESHLQVGQEYYLPILIYRYNGKSIRSTIGDFDYQKALRIQAFNQEILSKNLRKKTYQASRILWVPYEELYCSPLGKAEKSKRYITENLLGPNHNKIEIKSDRLKNKVFYLMSGHGGPDPGAIGKTGNKLLCEDEYAYDVTLRLYKLLLEQGAQAYMIIEDDNDGIRDDHILPCDQDESCGDKAIPLRQLERLNQRIIQVNKLYRNHLNQGVKDQICLSIHVDSRSIHQRQDVFFCHYPSSNSSKKLAKRLQSTFRDKYRKHRSNGLYEGSVEGRNFYVLKNTLPPAVLIELANIQNVSDHKRFLLPSNRQALAKWLLEGLLSL